MAEIWNMLITWAQDALGISPIVLERLIWSALTLVAYFLIRLLGHAFIWRRVEDVSRRYLAYKSLNYALGFSMIVMLLIVWFGNATGWMASLGIVSAGLAIALQDLITNLAGWIFIGVRKPFIVGDRIQIGEHRGDVIDMRLFQFTLVEIGNWVDADQSTGRMIHIPNGWVFKHTTANYTRGFNFIWNEIPVMVTFESDWEAAKEILTGIAAQHSLLQDQEAQEQVRQAARQYMIRFRHLTPIVWTDVADSGVTLTIRYVCDPRRRRSSTGAIWEDILRAFAARDDIDFAYPTVRYYDNMAEGKPGAKAAPRD